MQSRRWSHTSRIPTSGWDFTSPRRWPSSRRRMSVPLLLAPLLRSDASGRWRAAYVLGERKEPRAVSVLARALRDDEVLVASTAAGALAKIGTPAAIAALIGSLTSERPAEVHTAMNGLLTLGDAAVPALAEALEAADSHVEFHASQVLEAIGTPAAMAALERDAVTRDTTRERRFDICRWCSSLPFCCRLPTHQHHPHTSWRDTNNDSRSRTNGP